MDEHIINIVLGLIEGAVKKLESLHIKLYDLIEKKNAEIKKLETTKKRAAKLLSSLKLALDD